MATTTQTNPFDVAASRAKTIPIMLPVELTLASPSASGSDLFVAMKMTAAKQIAMAANSLLLIEMPMMQSIIRLTKKGFVWKITV